MKKDPVVLSYFTKGTPYEREAEALRISCEKAGLEYRIEGIAPFGTWAEHTCYKPVYIYEKIKELKRAVLWIDADAEIVKKPSFDFECDIAVRAYDHYPPDHPYHILAGTVYINYTPKGLEILQLWAERCKEGVAAGHFTVDQQVLAFIFFEKKIPFYRLAPGYTAIFEEEMEEKFIVHYQASRLYKKMISEEVTLAFFDGLSVDELREMRPRVPK